MRRFWDFNWETKLQVLLITDLPIKDPLYNLSLENLMARNQLVQIQGEKKAPKIHKMGHIIMCKRHQPIRNFIF